MSNPDSEVNPGALVDRLLERCEPVRPALTLILIAEPGIAGLQVHGVRHPDERRTLVLQARLAAELRALSRPAPPPVAGTPAPLALPVGVEALPEPVRAVLAEEPVGEVVVVPMAGPAGPLGVLVLARRQPLTGAEFQVVLAAATECGTAFEKARLIGDSARATALAQMLPDAVIAIDPHDLVTGWNAAAERIYGIPATEAVGHQLDDLVRTMYHDGDKLAARATVLARGWWAGRVRQTTRDGRIIDVEARVSPLIGPGGEHQGLIAVNRDISEMASAQAVAQAQSRFAQDLMDSLDSCAAVLDAAGVVTSANAHWRAATRERARCVCGPVAEGSSWLEALRRAPGPEAGTLTAEVANLLRGRLTRIHIECTCGLAGLDIANSIDVVRVDAGAGGAVVVQIDVVRPRPKQDELTFRATHDELTGLPNRAALMEGLSTSLQRLDGSGKLAVLFCDLDGFKDINDGLGHAVGDQVLVAVARRLRQRCRSADVVARFGGDEFVVVLSISDVTQAVAMADRIVEVLDEPIVVGEVEVAPGVSVGITVVDVPPDDDDPVGTLLRDADTAMYHAKGRGRGRYELFDTSLRENIEERLELAAALHRAVGDGELEIVYQSRRYCGDRQVAGVEALLRWRHPDLGLVEPDVFIPIAERTGRIVELGDWVLRRALSDFAHVADRRQTLAVNVSPRQLVGGKLVRTVADALAESGVAPDRLVLEITESAFVDDPAAARAVLADLRELGVLIALDDFGTGWSSLSYLRTLPVDVLKIDRSFVADLPTDLDACAVVSAVLGLGHGMGLVVVAEGVENEDHLAVLRDMGCDEYQGFIDGGPGPLHEVLNRRFAEPARAT